MAKVGLKGGFGAGLERGDFSELSLQLEHARKKTKLFRRIITGLALLIVIVAIFSFDYFIWRYAVIDNPKISLDSVWMSSNRKRSGIWIRMSFDVKKSGILECVFPGSTLVEPVNSGEKRNFRWRCGDVPQSQREFTAFIRSISGVLPGWETKTFSIPGR